MRWLGRFPVMRGKGGLWQALLAVGLALLACGGPIPGSATPTPPPVPTDTAAPGQPTATPQAVAASGLEVRGAASYIDSFNYYHLVGEVFNGSDQPVTGIELMAHVADASGQGALDGDERPMDGALFSPLVYTLAPGESSPYDFFRILPDGADIANWQAWVTIASSQPAELQRAPVTVTHTRLDANEQGTYYLTGELVNPGASPLTISSFAGALRAPGGAVLAANATSDFSGYLAAAGDPAGGDRTPFVIAIDGPAEAGLEPVYYVDAEVSAEMPVAEQIGIEVTNRYADEFDDLHLAANVTNNSSDTLTIRLVAGLYAADGTVIDTASATLPIYVAPGTSVPVSFDYFNSLNRDPEAQALVERVSVQVDPLWTYNIPYAVAALETANEVKEPVGTAQYSFRGDVVNSSTEELTSATLILSILDSENRLVATSWTNVYPETEVFLPGETLPFDMSVYLPTGVDLSTYSFTTLVQGYVKE